MIRYLVGAVLLCLGGAAIAQVTVNLSSSAPSGISPHSHTLTWTAPGAVSCTASGSWTGQKAASGSQAITGLTSSASYKLDCVGTAPTTTGSAVLTWVPPTKNTDGSNLTNLAAYDVSYGTSCATLSEVKAVPAPSSGTTITPLAVGSWCFGVKARTTTGQQSALSNTATKTIVASPAPTGTATVAVSVDTQPAPPTGLSVVEPTAWSVEPDGSNFFSRLIAMIRGDYRLDRVVGEVALGTSCSTGLDVRESGYHRVPRDAVKFTRYDSGAIVAKCS